MRAFCRLSLTLAFLAFAAAPGFASRFVVTGADAGGGPHVIVRYDADNNGTFETMGASFYPFTPSNPAAPPISGGVRVATGDFNGDGNDELVTATGPGTPALVRIWSLTGAGQVSGFVEEVLPFGSFTGGVFVASGDFDDDGRDELVTSADAGGGPVVLVWRDVNHDGRVTNDPPMAVFYAYTPGFGGGVRVAAGDVNNAGGDELITAPGPGGGPHIRVLSWNGSSFVSIDEFYAYTPGFGGGVYVAAGPISAAGNGGAEIITAPGPGGGPDVRIFTDVDGDGQVSDDALFDEFYAYYPAFTGGVHVAVGDTDASGALVEVVTAPGPGGGPDVRIFDDNADVGAFIADNPLDDEFFAYDPAWTGGVFVAVGQFASSAFAFQTTLTLPDSSTSTVFICVPPGAGIIRDLDVGLGIAHTFDGDLDVTLTHVPSGISVPLFTDVGGNDDGFLIRLSDQAGPAIDTAVDDPMDRPVTGTWRPEAPALLSAFNGQSASGCWMLTITDDSAGDSGTLLHWILYFAF